MGEASTAIYVRDTEATDSEEEQRERALDYATRELHLDSEDIVILSDTDRHARTEPSSGDQELFELAAAGDIERVIICDPSRIAKNIRDLNDRVTQLVDHGVAVHIIEPELQIGETERKRDTELDDESMLHALDVAAEIEEEVSSGRTREGIAAAQAEGKHVGRPPFGFDSDGSGNLVPNDDFETALTVIEQVESGESIRSTANDAGITRTTVRNILDRKDLYRST